MKKTKTRGFEVVSKYVDDHTVRLPKRSTTASAGYDFSSVVDIEIKPMKETLTSTLVPTGIKAYMPENEFLMLVNRSSSPRKRQLALPNGIGIIDADYYNNENNEGEIFLQLINYGEESQWIKKGERICQGIFTTYYLADDEEEPIAERTGGFGSSGK